jgi:hypothetical protein
MRLGRTLTAIALCAAGCGGAQEGKYANSGNREVAVLPGVGSILIARGAALRDSAIVGPEENLLYVLVVCPGLEGGSTGGRSNVGRFTSEYWRRWSTSAGEISLALAGTASRIQCTLLAGSMIAGMAMLSWFAVMQRQAPGLHIRCRGIGPQLTPADALRQIQSQLSDDPVISSLGIYPEA